MSAAEEAIENAGAILGEQYQNYVVIVQHDDETVERKTNNTLISKALCQEVLQQLKEERELENVEVEWEDDEEEAGSDYSDENWEN
jgi:hypothetical protein